MNRRFAVALLALLAFTSPLRAAEEAAAPATPAAPADTTAQVEAARTAATAWLALIDAGDYAGSWNAAAAGFKTAVTTEQWTQAATSVRGPLGALQTRTEKSAAYNNAVPGAPPGEYVIMQFDTAYANKAGAVETAVAMLDADGSWRIAGYFIQ